MEVMQEYVLSLQGLAVAWFSGVFALMAMFRVITKNMDQELDEGVRDAFALKLLDLKPGQMGNWVPVFNRVFDQVFGRRHFTWRCFGISLVISVVFYGFFFWFYIGLFGVTLDERDSWLYLGVAPLFAFMCNGIIDYFSLLETRWVMGTKINLMGKLILDIVLTVSITFVWAVLFLSLFSRNSLSDSYELVMGLSGRDIHDQVLVLAVFTTSFTTSVWLWLHGAAQFTIRLMNSGAWMVQKLNVTEAPVRAIGVVINMYVLCLGGLGFLVYLAVRSALSAV